MLVRMYNRAMFRLKHTIKSKTLRRMTTQKKFLEKMYIFAISFRPGYTFIKDKAKGGGASFISQQNGV